MKRTACRHNMIRAAQPALLLICLAGSASVYAGIPALTYEVVHTRYSEDGEAVVTRETHAVRRDGSTVSITPLEAEDGSAHELWRIEDMARGEALQIDTASHTVFHFPLQRSAVDQFLKNGPAATCGAPLDATRMSFAGYSGLRFSTFTDRRPDEEGGEVEIVRLVSPQLGCAELLTVFRENGRVTGIRQIENIRPGEPDPSLFEIPADFRKASPDEVSRLARGKSGLQDDHG